MMYFFIPCMLLFFTIPCSCLQSEPPPKSHLSQRKWEQCEQFIQNESPSLFAKGITYIHPRKNLPCAIEQDPMTGYIYIHLKGMRKAFIGEGCFKQVTKSILYGKKPKLVARCRGGKSLIKEAEILGKLHGARGIVQLKSFIQHERGNSDLILEYYNAGSLRNVHPEKRAIQEKELFEIIKDLVVGLKHLHSAGYIHRDLHRGNILLNRENGRLHAALTDFGLALKIKENPNSRISVQDSVCAPEVLLESLSHINRKKAETYSLGALFYFLITGKKTKWAAIIKQHELNKCSNSRKIKMYRKIQSLYNREISRPQKMAGLRKDLTHLTFKLINPNPRNRLTLPSALKNIKAIANKWNLYEKHIALDHMHHSFVLIRNKTRSSHEPQNHSQFRLEGRRASSI